MNPIRRNLEFLKLRLRTLRNPVFLEYPMRPSSRWGWGKPDHPELAALFAKSDERYAQHLTKWAELRDFFGTIPAMPVENSLEPFWETPWLTRLDAVSLCGMVFETRPKRYFEVGSGMSTRFVRATLRSTQQETRIVSIDPSPRKEVDALCDRVIRKPLETVDLSVFGQLERGDVLFIDNSHYLFTNSDVCVSFLEVIPRLASGVHIGIHDIFLPADYPPSWNRNFYNEQYMLAALLLGGEGRFSVQFPAYYASRHPTLRGAVRSLVAPMSKGDPDPIGATFWMTKA